MQHKWLTPGIVYQATAANYEDDVERISYDLCETAFKKTYWNHTSSFRHETSQLHLGIKER